MYCRIDKDNAQWLTKCSTNFFEWQQLTTTKGALSEVIVFIEIKGNKNEGVSKKKTL